MRILFFLLLVGGILVVAGNMKRPPSYGVVPSQDAGRIVVDVDAHIAPFFVQGFLTGIGNGMREQFNHNIVSALRPVSWRIADMVYYDKVKPFGADITLVVAEQYVNARKGWNETKPWENWKDWEGFVKQTVRDAKAQNRPVAYWDIWGEPDIEGGTSWKGNYAQLLELFARGYHAIHEADPDARVVGPSTSEYKARFRDEAGEVIGLETFIRDLARIYNVKLDAISWHELGSLPEEVPAHAAAVRSFLAKEFPGYAPPFHINEYSAEADHLIPGWGVGWLYYLEQAQIASANRACWNVKPVGFFKKPWSDCWAGLNGLLLQDNATPQPLYWVHRAYAELRGIRVKTENTQHVAALGSYDQNEGAVQILLGRSEHRGISSAAPQNIEIVVKNYPYASSTFSVQHIARGEQGSALPSLPEPVLFGAEKAEQDLRVQLDGVLDGDAYLLILRPKK